MPKKLQTCRVFLAAEAASVAEGAEVGAGSAKDVAEGIVGS